MYHLRLCNPPHLLSLLRPLHPALRTPAAHQASYLTWGYLQEKVMTTEYTTGRFPSAAFCVFSNRVFAIDVPELIHVHAPRVSQSIKHPNKPLD